MISNKFSLLGFAPVALLVLSSFVVAQNPSFTLEQVMSSPFPTGLTAASTGERIAWTSAFRGVRNVWVADGPSFTIFVRGYVVRKIFRRWRIPFLELLRPGIKPSDLIGAVFTEPEAALRVQACLGVEPNGPSAPDKN